MNQIRLLVIAGGLILPSVILGQEVRVYVTSQAGDRIAAKPSLHFGATTTSASGFDIDDNVRDQEIIGFGASFLESGAICLNSLIPERQEALLQALFDPEKGAGFTVMKADIAPAMRCRRGRSTATTITLATLA